MSPCPDIGSQCHNDWSEPRQSVISQVVMKAISVQYSPGVILTKFDAVLKLYDKRREGGEGEADIEGSNLLHSVSKFDPRNCSVSTLIP